MSEVQAKRCDRCGVLFVAPNWNSDVDLSVHGRVLTGDACRECAQTIWGAVEHLLPLARKEPRP